METSSQTELDTTPISGTMIGTMPKAFHKPTAYILLMLVTAIWGSTFLITKHALHLTSPFTFLSLRFAVATIFLMLAFHRRLRRLTRAELMKGSLIGLFLFATIALQALGLQTIASSKAGFLVGLYVPIVPLIAVLFLRQKPTLEAIIGVALSFAGLIALSLNSRFDLHIGQGEWLMLGAALAAALHILGVGKFASEPEIDAVNLTIVQIGVTALLSFGMVFVVGEPKVLPVPTVWLPVIMMGLFATAFTFVVMNRVQEVVGSTRATLIYALEPVWAGLFGGLAGETLGLAAWVGCSLILVGMIVGGLKFRSGKAIPRDYCPGVIPEYCPE